MSNQKRVNNALSEKRRRFEKSGAFPWKKAMALGVTVVVVVALGAVAYRSWRGANEVSSGIEVTQETSPPEISQFNMVSLSSVRHTSAGISFPLADVEKNHLIKVVYNRKAPMPSDYAAPGSSNGLPLLSYVAPSGQLIAATSFCEPCRSDSFHIEGNELVCDVCFTRWDLNTLQGVSGGCVSYPPEVVKASLSEGQVSINSADLEAWRPRT